MAAHAVISALYASMTTKNLRLDMSEHAARALLHISQFGWLRATELGRLLHPGQPYSRKYAEAHLRKLSQLRLVIARQLPGADAGRAYVLSSPGANQLNDWRGERAHTTGKDWGSMVSGVWSPPASWRHDLIATGVLSLLAEKGLDVYPESYLRRTEPDARKHPDGLIADRENCYSFWLEVENARKSGRNIDRLVEALAKASRATPVTAFDLVQDAPVQVGLVAINANARDERGYRLNHLQRVESTLRKIELIAPLRLDVAWIKMRGVGVESLSMESMLYPATISRIR
jgi:hypothetical protein